MKTCKQCGNPLTKYAHESKARFEQKQFDSGACSRLWLKTNRQGWWGSDRQNTAAEEADGRREYSEMRGEI